MRLLASLSSLAVILCLGAPEVLSEGPVGAGGLPRTAAGAGGIAVDLELVLAVDVSRSMDYDEQVLQRAGYVGAFRDPEVLRAIRSGPLGRIAVTYVEWAGAGIQKVVVPWTLVEDPASGDAVARLLEAAPLEVFRRTSISDALLFSAAQFPGSGYTGARMVIDISGDGPNNHGVGVVAARERVLDQGIVINGLPIMLKRRTYSGFFDVGDLDLYYEDCVIGGFGAFIVPVTDPREFVSAIRRKLVLEIAGATPSILPAQASRPEDAIDCSIGERLWDNWMQGRE